MLTEEEQWGHKMAKMFDDSDEDSDLDEYPLRMNRGDEYLVSEIFLSRKSDESVKCYSFFFFSIGE